MAFERLNRPGWRLVLLAAAAALIWVGFPFLGRRLDFFRVRRVELVGVRGLPPDSVLAALTLRRGASVFDPMRKLEKKLSALPGVREASIGRRLPGTLRVTIREAAAVGLVPRPRGLALLDESGRLLPFDAARAAPDLPVAASADSVLASFLARARDLEPSLFARINAAERIQGDIALEVGSARYWFRPDASLEEMHAVIAVAQDLARRGRPFAELDGRFAGQVVVRRSRG